VVCKSIWTSSGNEGKLDVEEDNITGRTTQVIHRPIKVKEGNHWERITTPQSLFILIRNPSIQTCKFQPIEVNGGLEDRSEVPFNLSFFRGVVIPSLEIDVNR